MLSHRDQTGQVLGIGSWRLLSAHREPRSPEGGAAVQGSPSMGVSPKAPSPICEAGGGSQEMG